MATVPQIPGYVFRGFDMAMDPPLMAELINACNRADGIEERTSREQIATDYRNAENCDLMRDVLMVEHEGRLAGYTRTLWWQVIDGPRIHAVFAHTHPQHRTARVAEALIDWSQERGAEVAAADGAEAAVYEGWAEQNRQTWLCRLFEQRGYEIDTYGAGMVRPNLDDIGEVVLPEGVEIRPAEESHLRTIWEADNVAFRDHYGAMEGTEAMYQRFLESPKRDESLWKIAWAGDEVVGQVKTYVDADENAEYGRKRGYTEDISTAREWRKQGIATALINASLEELARRGFEEAALGVHTENPHGALRLYEGLGYEITEMYVTYRKPVPLPG